jgi:hypothetical protein
MGNVLFTLSLSLDGFIAGPHDEVDRLFRCRQVTTHGNALLWSRGSAHKPLNASHPSSA